MVVNKVDKIKIKKLLEKNWEIYLVFLILLISAFLRLYRISDYLTFLGDEGRDALVWLRMTRGKFTLIGPQTSVGNMYLGPLYYYLMLPFYLAMGIVGPSVGVALLAVATTFLLWLFGKKWFSSGVGLISAFFYAISPVAIIFSRTSWNPNVLPFFSLLIFWGIWQFWKEDNYRWLTLLGIFLSFTIQSHYLALILLILTTIFWVSKVVSLIKAKDKKKIKKFSFFSLLGSLFFIALTIVPLVWFDLRHNFLNFKAFRQFFTQRTTVKFNFFVAISKIFPLWQMLISRLVTGYQQVFGFFLSSFMFLFLLVKAFNSFLRKEKKDTLFFFFVFSLFFSLLLIGLYQQSIYDHYLGFLFPITFLFFAFFLKELWEINLAARFLAIFAFIFVVFFQIKALPLRSPPDYQLKHTREIATKIFEESGEKPFNLGMIAKQNYDAGYRYFLEKWGKKPVEINPQIPQTITEQLFVVCEEKECQPTTSPQAEIAFFGWSKIEKEWDFPWGVKLFKLGHQK